MKVFPSKKLQVCEIDSYSVKMYSVGKSKTALELTFENLKKK